MKTNNVNHYRLVRSCFIAFCDEQGLTPYNNAVTWEHDHFCCVAHRDEKDYHFIAVDACCPNCEDETVDYCFFCKRHNQIDFEAVN